MAKKNHQVQKQKLLGRQLTPWLILVAALFVAGLVIATWQTGKVPEETVPVVDVPPSAAREILLYFSSADGQTLLAGIGFDGTGDYYGGKGKNATDEINGYTEQEAHDLAGTLDTYNNGNLCP